MKKTILLFAMLLPFFVFSQNITNITPNQAMQGQTLSLVISGNNMSFGSWSCWSQTGNISDFKFSQSGGTNPMNGIPISSTATQLNGNLIVPAFQPTGAYNLEVFNGSNCNWVLLPNSFQINAPSWDCDPSTGICSDPGTGQGSYTSLATCQSNCTVTPSWDCDGQGNCADPGTGSGAYASLATCQSNCTGNAINEEISSLLIYPNPTKNTFTIDGNYTSATIYDVFGKVVFCDNTANYRGKHTKKIDLSGHTKGIYFLDIKTGEGVINKKLLLQ